MFNLKKSIAIFIFCIVIQSLCNAQMIKDSSVEYINQIENSDSAINIINKLLLNKNNSLEIKSNLQVKLANRYSAKANYDSAVWYANKFITEQEPKIKLFLPKLYNIKAGGYYYMFNLEKGMESLQIGIDYAIQINDSNSITVMSSNLGAMLTDKGQLVEAEKKLLNSLNYNKKNTEYLTMSFYLTKRILATTYELLKRNKEAETNYLEALEGLKKNKSLGSPYFGALTFYARFLSKQQRSKEAFSFLNKSIEVSKNSNNQKDLTALYYVASLIYKENNQKDSAIAFLDRAYGNQLKEFQQEQSQNIATSEAKFGNEILKRDIKIANQKKQNLIFAILLLVSILILSIFSFYFFQKRKEAHQKLETHQKTTDAYLEGEEKEKVRLSRELHDGIAQDLLALRFAFKQQGVAENNLAEIDKIGAEVRNLSHQLMPLTLKMLGLLPAIEEMCNKIFPTTAISHQIISEGIEQRLPLTLETSLYRIVQELVQNITKHSHANEVIIQLIQKNNIINLIIEDNGQGFDTTLQTQGIGLFNLKSRVQMINGQLQYESTKGDGTTTIIRIPIKS